MAEADPREVAAAVMDITTAAEAGEVSDEYRDRLLFYPARDMVVIKGGCDGEALVSLVFVTPEQTGLLRGVLDPRSLEEYLAENAGVAVDDE